MTLKLWCSIVLTKTMNPGMVFLHLNSGFILTSSGTVDKSLDLLCASIFSNIRVMVIAKQFIKLF